MSLALPEQLATIHISHVVESGFYQRLSFLKSFSCSAGEIIAFKEIFGDEATELDDLEIDRDETLVEGVGNDVKEAIETLSLCGLNDAFLFLRKYRELSDGQNYRYKLAKLMDNKDKNVWIIDEFCATLDPVMAPSLLI